MRDMIYPGRFRYICGTIIDNYEPRKEVILHSSTPVIKKTGVGSCYGKHAINGLKSEHQNSAERRWKFPTYADNKSFVAGDGTVVRKKYAKQDLKIKCEIKRLLEIINYRIKDVEHRVDEKTNIKFVDSEIELSLFGVEGYRVKFRVYLFESKKSFVDLFSNFKFFCKFDKENKFLELTTYRLCGLLTSVALCPIYSELSKLFKWVKDDYDFDVLSDEYLKTNVGKMHDDLFSVKISDYFFNGKCIKYFVDAISLLLIDIQNYSNYKIAKDWKRDYEDFFKENIIDKMTSARMFFLDVFYNCDEWLEYIDELLKTEIDKGVIDGDFLDRYNSEKLIETIKNVYYIICYYL